MLWMLTLCIAAIPCAGEALSNVQRTGLESALNDLVDPRGKLYMRQTVVAHHTWSSSGGMYVDLWAEPYATAAIQLGWHLDRHRVFTVDRSALCIDFVADCEAQLRRFETERDATWSMMDETSIGATGSATPLMRAAWLYRLGHEELAARMLKHAWYGNDFDDAPRTLRRDLGWRYFAGAVHAFIHGDDRSALDHARMLRRYYPDVMDEFGTPCSVLVADLERRERAGKLGYYPVADPEPGFPVGFDGWNTARKVEWLIDALDQVDRRQRSQPGGVDLASDWRVQALIAIGDPAVPKLLDTLESDERLTRSMHFWRDFSQWRWVLSVREAALIALMSILQYRVFEANSTGDNFTLHEPDGIKPVVEKLRGFWAQWSHLSFNERMMAVLTNPESDVNQLLDAATNIAFRGRRVYGTTVWSTQWQSIAHTGPNPAVEQFSNPTAAEAILGAMQEHVNSFQVAYSVERIAVEEAYAACLVELGDPRIVEKLDGYRMVSHVRYKRLFATIMYRLGDDGAMRSYLQGVLDGGIQLEGAGDQREASYANELKNLLALLGEIDLPAARELRLALLDGSSPYYRAMRNTLLRRDSSQFSEWCEQAFALDFLRVLLDDPCVMKEVRCRFDGQWVSLPFTDVYTPGVPEYVDKSRIPPDGVQVRVCDMAAFRLNQLVAGLPETHPLAFDQDSRIGRMRLAFDKRRGSLRMITLAEWQVVGESWQMDWVLAPPPRPVSSAPSDVEAGRAIFALPSSSTSHPENLPARGKLKDGTGVLIVQKETDLFGKVWYGVVSTHEVRRAGEAELRDIQLLDEE